MSHLGDRHRGDLDGRLQQGRPVAVAVVVDGPATAPADQHTAWMLINLLARLEGVVERVLVVASNTGLHPRVCPTAAGATFPEALIETANAVGGVPVGRAETFGTDGIVFHIGPGPTPTRGWRVAGDGWSATLSTSAVPAPSARSRLPVGPYAAACLAAGEVFRAVCLIDYAQVRALSVNLWAHTTTTDTTIGGPGPAEVQAVLDFGLAGVGAVGVAVLHTLWACEGLAGRAVIADDDPEGVEETNLNRYVLFDRRHIDLAKASTAAAIYGGPGQLRVDPVDGRYDRDNIDNPAPRVLLSAVDGNESRHALQQGFAPGAAFGGSTQGLRAEVTRCGPPGEGPCLACFNPVDDEVPDTVRRSAIRKLDDSRLAQLAARIGSDPDRLKAWAASGDCGLISAEALGHLKADDEPQALFSVGFVSVMAGVMLAAELVRQAVGDEPGGAWQSVKFQFQRPDAPINGRRRGQRPDRSCAVCNDAIHANVWRRRHREAERR